VREDSTSLHFRSASVWGGHSGATGDALHRQALPWKNRFTFPHVWRRSSLHTI